jgi:O-antigen ligase
MLAMRTGFWTGARLTSSVSSLPFSLCALVTVGSLLLGGGTRSGFLSDAILQLLSIPPLLVSLWRLLRAQARGTRVDLLLDRGLAFCAVLVGIPFVQLIPLPPAIWTMLPNREPVLEAFKLVGGELPWMPISVSPEATWLSALSLIPPVAVFLCTQCLTYVERRLMSLLILITGLIGAFLGLLQVAQGPSSPLRFFAVTNSSEAVGFFANRNHFAALLYVMILLAAGWLTDAVFRARTAFTSKAHDVTAVAAVVISIAIIMALLSAEAMARSRAGLALTALALVGAFALAWQEWRLVSRNAAKLVAGSTALILLFVAEFTLYRIMERFAIDPLADGRLRFARNTFAAAMEYMPFGSGIGSFVSIYGIYERPSDTMINAFANHAHNDILEICLEAGIFGVVVLGFFAVRVTKMSVAVWRNPTIGNHGIDLRLARSATIIIILLALHSLVDYPLRTAAIMSVMAFACGLLVAPPMKTDKGTSLREYGGDAHGADMRRGSRGFRVDTAPSSGCMRPAGSQNSSMRRTLGLVGLA